jgi:hypothetical protein
MPVVTAGSVPSVNDLAAELARQLTSTGNAARATVGDRAQAFSWTAGIRPWAGSVFASTLADGMQWRPTLVELTATPPAKVAKGGTKPVAVTLTASTRRLSTYAGIGEMEMEDIADSDSLVGAVYSVLIDGCLQAFDADIGAALTAGAGVTATGPDWSSALLAGIAAVPSANVLVMAGADYASAASPSGGFSMSAADSIPVLFGLQVVLCAGLAAGTAFVANANALMVCDSRLSPVVVCDPYSRAETNTTRLVADLMSDAFVTAPGAVCAVTVTVGP